MKTINDWYDSPLKESSVMTKGGMIFIALMALGIFGSILTFTLGFREVAKMIFFGTIVLSMIILPLSGRLKLPQKK